MNPEENVQENWPLDEAAIALFAELRQAAQSVEAQARGALQLFIRQQNLQGQWQLAANGRELVRASTAMTTPA